MKHNLKNPLVLEESTEYYADSTSPDKYRPMPGQYVSKEVAEGLVNAAQNMIDRIRSERYMEGRGLGLSDTQIEESNSNHPELTALIESIKNATE